MALLGRAALAMWWDMAPAMRDEFEEWHTREHFPERLALPGFLRASRWADASGGEGFFVMYELAQRDDLASPEYLARLNAPTSWSRKLMPHHRNMVRSQCVVLESSGALTANRMLTLRFSPDGDEAAARDRLRATIAQLVQQKGIAGAHLLKTDAPAVPATTEQRIRGNADREADWVLLVCGQRRALPPQVALPEGTIGHYELSLAVLGSDLRDRGAQPDDLSPRP
jgi:nucleotide-binding universal stress UspA family protein